MIIKRDERILDARYLSREGDTGARWWSAMRGRNRVSVFNGSVVSSEATVSGRPGQLVFSDGASVLGPGESLYPQDAAYVCSGDTGSAAQYAGRYLGKWPLQANFAASVGFDPVTAIPSNANYAFTTVGGKSCVIGTGNPGITDFIATFSGSVRSTGYTISACIYSTLNGQRSNLSLNGAADAVGHTYFDTSITVDSAGVPPSPVGGYPDATWHHFALTFNSGQLIKAYANGSLFFTSNSVAASACRVRNNIRVSSGAIFGTLAYRNMRCYSRALSAAEIAAIAVEDSA